MAAQIKLGRFQWQTEKFDETITIHNLYAGLVDVGFVAANPVGDGYHWTLTADPDWPTGLMPTLSAAKDALIRRVRGVMAETPGNDYHEFCEMLLKPLPYSHIEEPWNVP
jgi:hypothetical protein